MASPDLGPWEPLPLAEVAELFVSAPFRWWVAGGHALALHLGRSWREHDDLDIGLTRTDVPALRTVLDGWDVQVAAAGSLRPWRGEPLVAERHENNLWCRRGPGEPWALDVTIGEGTADRWVYRRDPAVTVPWDRAVLRDGAGPPHLAPELQLLFKSVARRPKDDVDAAEVVPVLTPGRRAFLATHLPPGHPWQRLLGERV